MQTTTVDIAVVGGGAAGLSAALVLARARRRVMVIDAGSPRNGPAAHMQGFLSRDGLPPSELLALGREEIRAYGGLLCEGYLHGMNTVCEAVLQVQGRGGSRQAPHHDVCAVTSGALMDGSALVLTTDR